jgi:hypothetical protein
VTNAEVVLANWTTTVIRPETVLGKIAVRPGLMMLSRAGLLKPIVANDIP